MAARHKRKKTRYWIGNLIGSVLIGISGFMIASADDPAPFSYQAQEESIRQPSLDRAVSRPRAPLDESEELKIVKGDREFEIQESPSPEPIEVEEKPPEVVDQLYTTDGLRIRVGPSTDDEIIDVVPRGAVVEITGNTDGDWAEIIYDGEVAWVSMEFLSETEPPKPPPVFYEECPPSGSPAERGLTNGALHVIRCIEEAFPQIDSYGGVASRSNVSDHPFGRAVDAMIPNWNTTAGNELGWQIAEWVRERSSCFGVTYIIFDARIWSVDRASEGWRAYGHPSGSRSSTMLHLDHVHVSVSGSAGSNCKG